MNRKPAITVSVCVLLALAAALVMSGAVRPTRKMHYPILGNYYTADDGQSSIEDVATLVMPFERDGKTFVAMFVYTCDDNTPFTGYLEQYTPDAAAELQAIDPPLVKLARMAELGDHALLVKKPGQRDWVAKDSPEGQAITRILCPATGERARPKFPDVTSKIHP